MWKYGWEALATHLCHKEQFLIIKKTVYNETQDRMEQIPPKKQKMWFFFQSLLLKNHSAGLK